MLRSLLTALTALLRSRSDLVLENLALRQQLAVLQGRQPRRRMPAGGRLFWVTLRRLWPKWRNVLVVVKPETVVRWHRLGFRAFWRWRSRPKRPGRPKIDPKLRELIRRMACENPSWGAPRIHAELQLLGLEIAERTVSRYLDRDGLFDSSVLKFLRALEITPVRTAPRSPWQNGVLERWIGSIRRELLDHVVVFHERHLHRLLNEYVAYYHDDRPHLSLEKDAPAGRPVERPPRPDARIVSFPRVAGLHHRYAWRAAA